MFESDKRYTNACLFYYVSIQIKDTRCVNYIEQNVKKDRISAEEKQAMLVLHLTVQNCICL
jgi:hypothetical protein